MSLSPVQRITIIGTPRREFLDLLRFVSQLRPARQIVHFKDLSNALNGEPSALDDADLVVVLQSWSDQYRRSEVECLIGRTIFGRLLCCYGPWCESDGRTRQTWPDSTRVPVRLAKAQIEKELNDCDTDADPIPPTAARDEVFAHRLGTARHWRPPELRQPVNAAIVGPDRTFRRILSRQLTDLGIRSLTLPLICIQPGATAGPRETSEGPVHLLIHDLDPWSSVTESSLTAARQMFPVASVWGIASMPDAGLATETADSALERILPKLNFEPGLRWHIQQWSGATSAAETGQLSGT